MSALLLPPAAGATEATATIVLQTDSGPHSFNVEIADEEQEQRMGLMFRRSLGDDAGMLFLYDRPRPLSMWMKNTHLSLDMIFIDAAGKVHRIVERTEPYSTEPISSEGVVQGILEVKGGTARTIGLKPGDAVVLPDLGAPKH